MEAQKPKQDSKTKTASQFLRFSSLGLQMGLTIWVASIIGQWLDKKYPSESISWFKILTIFAVFGTIYSAIMQLIRISNEEEGKKSEPRGIKKFFKKK